MSRSTSPTALRALLAQQTDEVFVVCLTISHPSISDIRICSDNPGVTRTAGAFAYFPFEISLPDDIEDNTSRVQLRIDNVDRSITEAIRSLAGKPTIVMDVVLASSPNTVEIGPFNFNLDNAHFDALVIVGTLGYEEEVLEQAMPAGSYTPLNSPGLFP